MPDVENVISHLQIIHTWAEFAREHDLQFFTPKHLKDIAEWSDDALELLKEQEPVEPELEGGGSSWWHVCGECHGTIDSSDNFCKHCGRRIRHEKKAE